MEINEYHDDCIVRHSEHRDWSQSHRKSRWVPIKRYVFIPYRDGSQANDVTGKHSDDDETENNNIVEDGKINGTGVSRRVSCHCRQLVDMR